MTICIAAESRDGCFIAVSDRLLSFEFGSDPYLPGAENATGKVFDLGWGWYALGAGDLGIAKSVAVRVMRLVSEMNHAARSGRASRPQMERAFVSAYRHIRKNRLEGEILSLYGLNWREFHKGLASGSHRAIKKEMANYPLGIEFLVFGSDGVFRHMFEIRDPGVAEDRVHLGYWAVGNGVATAIRSLAVRITEKLAHAELIYRLCEAKFSCEGVEGIGRTTNVMFFNPWNGMTLHVHPARIDELRAIWERERRLPAPADAIALIAEALHQAN